MPQTNNNKTYKLFPFILNPSFRVGTIQNSKYSYWKLEFRCKS